MSHVAPIRRSYHRDTPECGHGTCGAVVDCTGECAFKTLPVIDERFLDEQINLADPMPIQFATDDPYTVRAAAIAFFVLFLAVSAGFYFAS